MNKLKIILFGCVALGLMIWAVVYIFNYESRLNKIETKLVKPTFQLDDVVRIAEKFYLMGDSDYYRPKLTHVKIDSIVKSMIKTKP